MPVGIETPIASSVANGVTTVFPHSFTVLQSSDLVVTGELSGALTTYSDGVDYAVTGVGSSSGAVTFFTPPAAGTLIVRYRDSALSRTTDYQNNGDFLAETVDQDFDRLWLVLQEIFGGGKGVVNALRVPNGETIPALGNAAARANRVQAYDGAGNPLLIVGVDASSAAALALDLASAANGKGDALVSRGGITANLGGTVTRYSTLAAAVTGVGSSQAEIVVSADITLSADVTLPVNCGLRVVDGAVITVATGVTLTLNGPFDAGWRRAFNVAGTGLVKGLSEIRFEWFGAKGDAVSPAVPVLGEDLLTFDPVVDIPTGTDDSAAIRTAVRCALHTEMMSNYLDPVSWGSPNVGPGSQPFWGGAKLTGYPSVIRGRPGAGYLVSGDNLLGPQSSINGKLYFDGQGCSFEWLPANTNDTFIDKLDLIERPIFANFNLRTWGFTGNRGRFVHTADTKQFMNVLRGPLFHNINIDRGGYYFLTTDPLNPSVAGPVTGNALSKVIHLEGTNLCDTWEFSHFQAWGYLNLLTLSNSESVAISFHDSDLGSYYTNAVHVDVTTGYSGGLWFSHCELGMLGSGQTWFRTRAAAASIGDFHINKSRMETRYDDFTVIDAEFGAFYIDDLQPNFGNPGGSANAYSLKATKWTKTAQFRNCWMPRKVKLWAYTDANYTTYAGNFEPIVYDTVTFPSGSPTVEWVNSNTLASVDIPALFAAFLRFRDLRCINSPQDWNFSNSLRVSEREHTRMIAFFDPADGKTFIDNAGITLPLGILVTSIKVICDSSGGAACDRINLAFTGGPSMQALISATDVTTTELIPTTKKGVCIVSDVTSYNVVTADYYNGVGTPAAVRVPCRIVFTYRSLLGATDLNTASLVPTLV